jgi:hypothetical protein
VGGREIEEKKKCASVKQKQKGKSDAHYKTHH